tara:strand:- start:470 stop:664 length:195 start_codon:yes stop_codon:yes gene_type:complete
MTINEINHFIHMAPRTLIIQYKNGFQTSISVDAMEKVLVAAGFAPTRANAEHAVDSTLVRIGVY